MGLRDEIASDVSEIISDLAAGDTDTVIQGSFTWAGASYDCAATTDSQEVIVSLDGNPTTAVLALLVKPADFPSGIIPQSGAKLSWNNKTYKVARTRDLHGAAAWLYCVDWKASSGR